MIRPLCLLWLILLHLLADGDAMSKTYTYRVVVEPDDGRWQAYCPALEDAGAVTWGYTPEEALYNIQELLELLIGVMLEDGEEIPAEIQDSDGLTNPIDVTVTVSVADRVA